MADKESDIGASAFFSAIRQQVRLHPHSKELMPRNSVQFERDSSEEDLSMIIEVDESISGSTPHKRMRVVSSSSKSD